MIGRACTFQEGERLATAPQWDDPRPLVQQARLAAGATGQVPEVVAGPTFGQRIVEGVVVAVVVALILKRL